MIQFFFYLYSLSNYLPGAVCFSSDFSKAFALLPHRTIDSFFFFFFLIFTYLFLAALGLSVAHRIFSCGMQASLLRHADS